MSRQIIIMNHGTLEYDHDADVLILNGVRFAPDLLKHMATADTGTPALFRIIKRENGDVTVRRYADLSAMMEDVES